MEIPFKVNHKTQQKKKKEKKKEQRTSSFLSGLPTLWGLQTIYVYFQSSVVFTNHLHDNNLYIKSWPSFNFFIRTPTKQLAPLQRKSYLYNAEVQYHDWEEDMEF